MTRFTKTGIVIKSAIVAAAFAAFAAPQAAQAEVRQVYKSDGAISPQQAHDFATYFAKGAVWASPNCAAKYLSGRLRRIHGGAIFGAINWVAGGDNGCLAAQKMALAAAWLEYYASIGRANLFRLYVYKDVRGFRPDVCHVYIAVGNRWVVGDGQPYGPLQYSTLTRLKCAGEQ